MTSDTTDRLGTVHRQPGEALRVSGGVCAGTGSPFTAEELALLDQLRALKQEWRELTGQAGGTSPGAHGPDGGADARLDSVACRARLQEIATQARRLRTRAAAARRRRMIALGHLDAVDEPYDLSGNGPAPV